MNCPHCRAELIPSRKKTGVAQFHSCPDCKGRAIDRTNLLQQIDADAVDRLFNVARGEAGSLGCPGCGLIMFRLVFKQCEPALQLDRCSKCGITWFDFSEFHDFKKSNPRPTPTRIPRADYDTAKADYADEAEGRRGWMDDLLDNVCDSLMDADWGD